MCFSAEASFAASAGLTAIGVATLRRVEAPADRWVAAIPLAFAAHQFVEGIVWSTAPGGDAHVAAARLFAFLAYAAWPIYVPLAFLRHERDPALKRRLWPLVALGAFAGLWFLAFMLADPVVPRIRHGSLQYRFDYPWVRMSHMAYGIPAIVAPLLSRDRFIRSFGAGLFLAYLVAYTAWRATHPSVWCYFAAMLSVLIYAHFQLRDRSPAAKGAAAA